MKNVLLVLGLLVSIGGYAQGPEFQAPFLSPKYPMEDFYRKPPATDIPPYNNFNQNHRNQDLIILMLNDREIRNFNRMRIWHRLKERKRERMVRRWLRRHERNNRGPEYLRRERR